MFSRLYVKIFLSFMAILIIAMIMVAVLFRFTEGERLMDRIRLFARSQVVLSRTVAEQYPLSESNSVEALQDFVDTLAPLNNAKIWISDESGNVIVRSFPEPAPTLKNLRPVNDDPEDIFLRESVNVSIYKCSTKQHCIYVLIPFGGAKGIDAGTIHYLSRKTTTDKREKIFLFGLLGIGCTVTLLLMPISMLITRRLNTLRTVAHNIADGDLTCRADICGKDEVSKVGWAINHMADSLSRMINSSKELTANVSHELRTPLTRIRIAEEMLRERFGEASIAHLDSIREDVDSLDHLIGRMLELSKLNLKEAPFHMESIDAVEVVESITTHLTPIAEARDLSISTVLPADAYVRADGEALFVALRNLVENCAKYAPAGTVITVTLSSDETGLIFSTENEHAPLPENELITIFEPFRRAKGTKAQGTGLGLAITKRIIEGHGGTIRAENGNGTVRFVVKLPAV